MNKALHCFCLTSRIRVQSNGGDIKKKTNEKGETLTNTTVEKNINNECTDVQCTVYREVRLVFGECIGRKIITLERDNRK